MTCWLQDSRKSKWWLRVWEQISPWYFLLNTATSRSHCQEKLVMILRFLTFMLSWEQLWHAEQWCLNVVFGLTPYNPYFTLISLTLKGVKLWFQPDLHCLQCQSKQWSCRTYIDILHHSDPVRWWVKESRVLCPEKIHEFPSYDSKFPSIQGKNDSRNIDIFSLSPLSAVDVGQRPGIIWHPCSLKMFSL